MLCHPALVLTKVRSDSKCEALFTKKNVSAVTRVNRDNCVILGELADVSLLFIYLTFCVETTNPVIAVAENIENSLADSCHDSHVEYNIYRVCKLNADLCKR